MPFLHALPCINPPPPLTPVTCVSSPPRLAAVSPGSRGLPRTVVDRPVGSRSTWGVIYSRVQRAQTWAMTGPGVRGGGGAGVRGAGAGAPAGRAGLRRYRFT